MKLEYRTNININSHYPSNTAIITRVVLEDSDKGVIEIPDEIEFLGKYYKVNEIDERHVFIGGKLKKITFPKYLEKIKSYILNGQDELEEVIFNGPTSIEPYAFSCLNLESVVWKDVIREYPVTICFEAFFGCERLKKVTLHPETVMIEDRAFYNSDIKSITLPSNIYHFGKDVFLGCKELKNVYLLSDKLGLEKINLVNSLKRVNLEEVVLHLPTNQYPEFSILYPPKNIKVLDIVVEECDNPDQCRIIPRLNEDGENIYSGVIVIPQFIWIDDIRYKVCEISDFAFAACPNLEEVKIPRGIKYNKELVFFNSPNVKIEEYE
jgi:hypothetical protein